MVAMHRPEFAAIGRLTVLAWHQRQKHLQELNEKVDKPWCVAELEGKLGFFPQAPDVSGEVLPWPTDEFVPWDFDMIDWTFWEKELSRDMFE